MILDLKNKKMVVVGLQGSGKTEFVKEVILQFKRPVWYLIHLDDLRGMSTKTYVIQAEKMNIKELDEIVGNLIILAKQKTIDCIVIDELDMFLNTNYDLNTFKNINDLIINHRHYGLSVIGITRRPQDIPTKFYESCEYVVIFAIPNSDNIYRKLKALDNNLPEMTKKLSINNHKFIIKKLGDNPILMDKINLRR